MTSRAREKSRRAQLQPLPRVSANPIYAQLATPRGSPNLPARHWWFTREKRWKTGLTTRRILLSIIAGAISVSGTGWVVFLVLMPVASGHIVEFGTDVFVPFEIVVGLVGMILVIAWLIDYLTLASRIVAED
jgi:hypothetical protein